jgi:hypothetical protein
MMRYLRMHSIWPRTRPFQLFAGVGPEVEVGVDVLAFFFAGYEALYFVQVAGGKVGGYFGAESGGFGV